MYFSSKKYFYGFSCIQKGVDMNNISFCGKTDFMVKYGAYDELLPEAQRYYNNLSKKSQRYFINGQRFTIGTYPDSITLIMKSGKKGYIRHIPIGKACERCIGDIENNIESLKKGAKDRLTVWLLGGNSFMNNMESKTIETVNRLAGVICDRPDIDTSILAGSKNAQEKFTLRGFIDKLELTFDKKINKDRPLEEELANYFDIVEFHNVQ